MGTSFSTARATPRATRSSNWLSGWGWTGPAQKLLQIAQFSPLYAKLKRDAAILYCLEHELDIQELQSLLQTLGLTLLGKRKKKK